MRVMVVGSKDWRGTQRIWRAMTAATANRPSVERHTLVSGGVAYGAENYAEELADEFGWKIERHLAEQPDGTKNFPRRNEELVAAEPDVCLAFVQAGSKWANDAASRAKRAGIPVWRYMQ